MEIRHHDTPDLILTAEQIEAAKTTEQRADELAARQQAATRDALIADTTADLTKLREAVDSLARLLADNSTAGSIRAWKAPITNNQNITGAQAKALADLLITDAQATRRIARQVLRLARSMAGDYSSADVGAA